MSVRRRWFGSVAVLVALGALSSPLAGCIPPGPPLGSLDVLSLVAPNTVRIAGWAFDPDIIKRPIWVQVSVDGKPVTTLDANKPRPDVAQVYPDAGPDHGFDAQLRFATGIRRICVTAANLGVGQPKELGCRTIAVYSDEPFGVLDTVTPAAGGKLRVTGWAIELNSTATRTIEVTAANTTIGSGTTGLNRPDVTAAYGVAGSTGGFDFEVNAPAGNPPICAQAVGPTPGTRYLLGCRSL